MSTAHSLNPALLHLRLSDTGVLELNGSAVLVLVRRGHVGGFRDAIELAALRIMPLYIDNRN